MESSVLVTGPPLSAPTQRERVVGILMHLLGMSGIPVVGPLVLWAINKERSSYLDRQGRELLNFHLSFLAYGLLTLLSQYFLLAFSAMVGSTLITHLMLRGFLLVGVPLLVVAALVWFFLGIAGVLHAWVGKVWKFPLTIRLL